jgi:hypothetical protein
MAHAPPRGTKSTCCSSLHRRAKGILAIRDAFRSESGITSESESVTSFWDENELQRPNVCHRALRARRPSRPILFGFARHGRRRWIFHLEPAIGAAWSVRRPKALRHDALAAERAGLFVDDDAVDLEMAIERDA